MAEPFKNLMNAALVQTAAEHLRRAWAGFPAARFVELATSGLGALEMKARVLHVASALEASLPPEFAAAAAVLERSLAPARADTDLAALRPGPEGLAGWIVWPMTEFVARRGLGEPGRALAALHALTQRFSAEFALRPFLVAHPEVTFAALRRWLVDPSAHVRRLVSEGSRPRLPWGIRLPALIADPSPTLPLLEVLQDDPSDYVRRSVGNHLNDIAKDHPDVVVAWVERHLPAASAQRRAVLERACRTLVKRRDRRVLGAFGVGAPLRGDVTLRIAPRHARIGGELTLSVTVHSTSPKSQRLVVDYAVHAVKADGSVRPKVWKGWKVELPAHGSRELSRRHSLRPVTTRRQYPGRHAVELSINGRVVATGAFNLTR